MAGVVFAVGDDDNRLAIMARIPHFVQRDCYCIQERSRAADLHHRDVLPDFFGLFRKIDQKLGMIAELN